jgi:hypothetical protein
MSQKFVSPGFIRQKRLNICYRQVGVTTLGLVGETTIGPAFQPIFIKIMVSFSHSSWVKQH